MRQNGIPFFDQYADMTPETVRDGTWVSGVDPGRRGEETPR